MTSPTFEVNTQPNNVVLPVGKFSPSIWGDRFISFKLDNKLWETYSKEVEALREPVKTMLATVGTKQEKIVLIDTLEQLGVSYHFEDEIEWQMKAMFEDFDDSEDYDLFTTSLFFRIFRQHGYKMSCDVYTKFRDAEGKLVDDLIDDAKGMLSLYEAAYLRVEGEDFLEEALVLTKASLKTMLPNLSPNLAEQVNTAMKCSFRRSLQRVHAISYISVYEKDPSKNNLLLRFAKTDYNFVQLLHLQEIRDASRWWKELHSKFPYARDRVVECYFFALSIYFEPRYSLARVILSKAIAMVSLLDDTYDAHATLDELKIFTDATERWDIKCIHMLPDYMKILYKALLDLFEEFEEELANQGRSYAVDAARGEMKELLRNYYTEAKWFNGGYTPSFDKYIENGIITSTVILLTTVSFLGMELATEDVFHWIATRPKAAIDAAMISRLMDDVSTYEVEKERGQPVTGINCYMKQYDVSKEKATHDFHAKVEKAWQGLTEECLKTNPISIRILQPFVYFSSSIEAIYRDGEDGYTHPEKVLRDTITSLLLTPQVNVNDG